MNEAKGKLQVVNTLTGEVMDLEWKNATELRGTYQEINAMIKTLERAKAKAAGYLDEWLGDQDRYDFGDGFVIMRLAPMRKKYQVATVRRYLDEDQLDLVLAVDGKKLKELMANLVQEGVAPAGAWKDIEAEAEVTPTKPYVKIEKAVAK
jgi:hypothetical protein